MKYRVYAALLLAILAAGCGGGDTIMAVNHAPTISFTFKPIAVPKTVPVDLTVSVADQDDGDALTVTWDISAGTLTPKNVAKTTMEWAVPSQLGPVTVTVTVSDGEETKSTTQTLEVGTLVLETALTDYIQAESPYVLRPTNDPPKLLVGDGLTVNVEAGVEIFVDVEATTIDITGRLNLNGTDANHVVIRPNDRSQLCSTNRTWWDGIVVNGANGKLVADYAEIWNAKNGVRVRDSGDATLRTSLVSCCGSNAILMEGSGALIVTDCEITNTQTNGITVSSLTQTPQSVTITDCNISINENAGISLDLHDNFNTVPITIEGNKLEFNFVHGIMMKNWVWPSIQSNSFYSNGDLGKSNIRLFAPFHDTAAPDTIDVSCNYWGAAVSSKATIEDTIYDRLDTQGLGTRLLVAPWMNSDPYKAPSPPPCDGGITR